MNTAVTGTRRGLRSTASLPGGVQPRSAPHPPPDPPTGAQALISRRDPGGDRAGFPLGLAATRVLLSFIFLCIFHLFHF